MKAVALVQALAQWLGWVALVLIYLVASGALDYVLPDEPLDPDFVRATALTLQRQCADGPMRQ